MFQAENPYIVDWDLHRYASCSSCFCWGSSKKLKAPIQIGLGWNLAGFFFN